MPIRPLTLPRQRFRPVSAEHQTSAPLSACRDSVAAPATLQIPSNIELRKVGIFTGLLYSDYCKEGVELAYIAGTAPTRTCGPTERAILDLPPYQQAYFVSNGKLDTGC